MRREARDGWVEMGYCKKDRQVQAGMEELLHWERCSTHISKLVVAEVGLVALEELHSQVAVQAVPLLQVHTWVTTTPGPPEETRLSQNKASHRASHGQGRGTHVELLQLVDGVLRIQQLVSQLHNLPVQCLPIHLGLLDLAIHLG